jgi:flavin reductase (DIM6/NTAB) family NADH-FMN oxidoreductase RutF
MDHTNSITIISGGSCSRLLNPRSAVLVTCVDLDGKPNAISVAWHTPISHDPPLVGISIGLTRYSHELITATGEYVINVVGLEMQPAVKFCGEHSGRDCDKIPLAGLELCPAKKIKTPLLKEALATLECQVEQQMLAGDHTFFIGRVVYAEAQTKYIDDNWEPGTHDVLLFLRLNRYGHFVFID